MTRDADVALPPTLPAQTPSIREALAANGFEEEFRGDYMPPRPSIITVFQPTLQPVNL